MTTEPNEAAAYQIVNESSRELDLAEYERIAATIQRHYKPVEARLAEAERLLRRLAFECEARDFPAELGEVRKFLEAK